MSAIENILVLGGDHFRHDAMGWLGNPLAQTPHIDALAKRSARFTQCFNQSPVCQPARHCLASGRYAHRNGVTMNGQQPYTDYRTLGHVLGEEGLRRFNIGHMHWHRKDPPDSTPHHGFEPWIHRGPWMGKMPGLERWRAESANGIRTQTGGPGPRPREEQTGFVDKERALESMREAAANDQRFLLWCAFSEPHPPFTPPREYYERIPLERIDLPELPPANAPAPHPAITHRQREWAHLTDYEVRQIIRAYYALVAMLDEFVGELLGELDRLGLREKTAVVWFSDHGDQLYEHRLFLKFVMREASVRTPLMIAGPGITPGTHEALVEHVDLAPTLCELLGLDPPEWMQGRSLKPFLHKDATAPKNWRDTVFSEIGHPDYHVRMARTRDWKLNLYADGQSELFNLREDPQEFVNLGAEATCANVRSEMTQRLEDWWQATAPPDLNAPRVPWD